jgi:hypothetical protein
MPAKAKSFSTADSINEATKPCPTAPMLLTPDSRSAMRKALTTYRLDYDDVFDDIHERLATNGHATKLDLAALITWKHIQNATWMKDMLALPKGTVESKTREAFAAGMSDSDRIAALHGLPGFGSGHAFTSALLAVWHPSEFGVFDTRASSRGWQKVVTPACVCSRTDLPVYFDHLRQIAREMGADWTPRKVDMALFNL